jgi:hypothetical protein
MPTLGQMFPAKFLKAVEDVPADGKTPATITDTEATEMKTSSGATETKYVLYFAEMQKGLVLNVTNARTLARAFGDNTDDWVGNSVELVVREVEFSGRTVPAIRIVIPKKGKA